MKIIKKILLVIIALVVLLLTAAVWKRVTPLAINHKQSNTSIFSDVSIHGYDPVAYFTDGKPVQGRDSLVYHWKSATWYFSSRSNLDLFVSNPEKYSPEFGGFCSFAVSKGFTADVDPNVFTIIHDKLYLFADRSVMEEWINGGVTSVSQSEKNWK